MSTVKRKERPIIFSGQMVRAILEGRKTQKRLVVKCRGQWTCENPDGPAWPHYEDDNGDWVPLRCPYGEIGDRLWVRETFNVPYGSDELNEVAYRADFLNDIHGPDSEKSVEGKYRDWRPSIHMPRWASRITLEITGVRVERLQEISEADARSEATFLYKYDSINSHQWFPVIGKPKCSSGIASNAKECFEIVWSEINGGDSWAANPWVWVIEFKRVKD